MVPRDNIISPSKLLSSSSTSSSHGFIRFTGGVHPKYQLDYFNAKKYKINLLQKYLLVFLQRTPERTHRDHLPSTVKY